MIPQEFPWDGSDIGEIDEHVKKSKNKDKCIKVKFSCGIKVFLMPFKNLIPIIADEIKPLFGIVKIGRHICTFLNKKFIMSKKTKPIFKNKPIKSPVSVKTNFSSDNTTSGHSMSLRSSSSSRSNNDSDDFMSVLTSDSTIVPQRIILAIEKSNKISIKKVFIFRYLMGLTPNNLNSLCYVTYSNINFITSLNDRTINYNNVNDLPNKTVKDFFKSIEEVYDLKNELYGRINLISLKFKLQDIIMKFDNNLLWWAESIIQKIYETAYEPEYDTEFDVS